MNFKNFALYELRAMHASLGFFLFARRYSGNGLNRFPAVHKAQQENNSNCFLFLLVLRCFTSQGALALRAQVKSYKVESYKVF